MNSLRKTASAAGDKFPSKLEEFISLEGMLVRHGNLDTL
jgi:hypothetical protein